MPFTLANIAFQALSLAVLWAYCLMVYRFRAQAAECLGSLVRFSSREGAGIENKRLYDRFLGVAMTLGALSAGLATVKVAAAGLAQGTGTSGEWQWSPASLTGTAGMAETPSWVALAAALGVSLAVVCIVLVEVGVLKIAGSVTLSEKFTDSLIQTKRGWMAAASMFAVPLVAVWTGVNPVRDTAITYIIAIVIIILSTLFAVQTLRGFVKQKVSVLIWFLYLCTVEIFPVCAVVLAVSRSV